MERERAARHPPPFLALSPSTRLELVLQWAQAQSAAAAFKTPGSHAAAFAEKERAVRWTPVSETVFLQQC